jgi:hypothetical protein
MKELRINTHLLRRAGQLQYGFYNTSPKTSVDVNWISRVCFIIQRYTQRRNERSFRQEVQHRRLVSSRRIIMATNTIIRPIYIMRKSLLCFLIWFVLYYTSIFFICVCVFNQERERKHGRRGCVAAAYYPYTIARIRQWTLTVGSAEGYCYAYFICYRGPITEPKTKVPLYYSRLYTESI